jgi:aminoglycoside phosphotransferase (APT) family kinase protein
MSKSWEEFFKINLSAHIKKCREIGVFNKKTYFLIEKLFLDNMKYFENSDSRLLHNDPGGRNIFIDGKNIRGIIDWEDAIIGDPLWEIAFIHSFLFGKEHSFKRFCRGYSLNLKILQTRKYWLYYLRICLIKAISRFSQRQNLSIDKKRIVYALNHLNEY